MVLFWKYLKRYKGLLVLALALAVINIVFSLLDPQIIRLIIDNYAMKVNELSKEEFVRGVGLLLLAFVGVALVSRIAKNFQDYYTNVITQRFGTAMYADSVEHTFGMPYDIFEDHRSGEVLEKLQKAREDSQSLVLLAIGVVFAFLVGYTFVVVYAFLVHWLIAASFLAVLPIVGVFMYIISKKIRKAQKEIVAETAELSGATTETLRNVQLVKSLGLEDQEVKRLNDVNEKILNLELRKVKLIRTFEFIQGTLVNATRAGLLFLMLFLLFGANITIGEFLTLFFYSFFLFGPMSGLGATIAKYQETKASNEQLEEILKTPMKKKPDNPVVLDGLNDIEFKDVSFSYSKDNDESAKNINIKVNPGESVAFVGLSGSGKTTLVKLLLGLYDPSKGKLLLNGVDSKTIDYDDFRKKIGLVSQDTQLFAGTVRENLLFVNPNATDEECHTALRLASVTDIIERGGQLKNGQEKGLDTKIGEGGIKISGGEKQRLAIARALLRKPELLIFDEATSNLDSLTEKEITKTIKAISKTKPNLISVLVAHRLSTISHANMIYVMEKAKVIEKGSHAQLLKINGLYAAMWREQSGGAKDGLEEAGVEKVRGK